MSSPVDEVVAVAIPITPTDDLAKSLIGYAIQAASHTERDARERDEPHLVQAAIDRQDELFAELKRLNKKRKKAKT